MCDRVSSDVTISEMKKDPSSAVYIPVRIREIIKDTLSPSEWDLSTLSPKQTASPVHQAGESSCVLLEKELKEAQEKLSQTEKDCMELSVKYITANEKVSYGALNSLGLTSIEIKTWLIWNIR